MITGRDPRIDQFVEQLASEYKRAISSQLGGYLSSPAFTLIVKQYRAWKRGIPPTREMKGYGGQNPRLMLAFDALERVENEVQAQNGRGGESGAAFAERIKAEVGAA